jgi:hypothetical protein
MLKQIGMTAGVMEVGRCLAPAAKWLVPGSVRRHDMEPGTMSIQSSVSSDWTVSGTIKGNVFASFFHQPVLLSENLRVNWLKHLLIVFVRVIAFKVCNHFFKRMEAQGWYLPPHHGSAFLNGRDSFGVGHIIMRGADWTYAVRKKPVIVVASGACLRREGKDNRPRRNFAGNVNCQPVAGGNFYGLGYCHKENIA